MPEEAATTTATNADANPPPEADADADAAAAAEAEGKSAEAEAGKKNGKDSEAASAAAEGDKGADKGAEKGAAKSTAKSTDKGKDAAKADDKDDRPIAASGDIDPPEEEKAEREAKPAFGPDNWREYIANGDEQALKQLSRFTDPKSLWKKIENQEKLIRSRKTIPDHPGSDASPEDVAKWRKEMGLPEKPQGYFEKLELANGKVLGDADKPIAESFAAALHEANAPQEAVNAAVNWYFDMQEDQEANRIEADDSFRREARDALRDEWGGDFKRNINAVSSLFGNAPGGVNAQDPESLIARVFTARTQDGRILGDDPDFVKLLSGLALDLNPAAATTPRGKADLKTIETELADLRALVAKDDSEYWRGPKSKQLQARFAELLQAEQYLKQQERRSN